MRFLLVLTTFVIGWITSYGFQIQTIKNLNSEILSLKRKSDCDISTDERKNMAIRKIKQLNLIEEK